MWFLTLVARRSGITVSFSLQVNMNLDDPRVFQASRIISTVDKEIVCIASFGLHRCELHTLIYIRMSIIQLEFHHFFPFAEYS